MVEDDGSAGSAGLFPKNVGERLRDARVTAGMDLQDVASKTRVPMRHLAAIERSEYAGLPSLTYATGFARAYARAVGIDEKAIAHDLRIELDRAPAASAATPMPYEPVDPARVPSRLLAWTALGVLVLVLGAYLFWRSAWWESADTAAPAAPLSEIAAPTSAAPAPATLGAEGPVVLTATAPVWVRIYDRARKTLFEREMAAGQTYVVPTDADQPMILTGRPQALSVTIGGQPVAPLGRAEATVSDLVVSAAALRARAATGDRLMPPTTRAEPDTNPVAVPPTSGNTGGV